MSTKFPGGIISKTPPVPSGAFENSTAPGVWTLEQQAAYAKLGQWPTAGNTQNFIEDVFSTYLYTGNGSTQTITNGIDLAGKGGLVWLKGRQASALPYHFLMDSARGKASGSGFKWINSNTTDAEGYNDAITDFNSNGFNLGSTSYTNQSSYTFASWTFRKQPKFFDVVTYTGNGSARTIAHNLGSAPGCIMIKCLNDTFDWIVWHRSFAANNYNAFLNTTDAAGAYSVTSSTAPTDTVFSLTTSPYTNQNGSTYVAYLFAHDAGGFGLNSTDNVISCGSFTTNSAREATVTLGYEPQWVMIKGSSGADDWLMTDIMRGASLTTYAALSANTSNAESAGSGGYYMAPTATGFLAAGLTASRTYIYIAIRRGPMRVPTDATKVFNPYSYSGDGTNSKTLPSVGFVPDWSILTKTNSGSSRYVADRLRGGSRQLDTAGTGAEFFSSQYGVQVFGQSAVTLGTNDGTDGFNQLLNTFINYSFRRAPSFFDEVCYTGNDVLRTITHNLGVAPEMMIIKNRNSALDWAVYHTGIGNTKYIFLNSTAASVTESSYWNNTSPTASVFTVNTSNKVNSDPSPYVAYLFATCAGVSKVGSYTGNGTTQTINCGFGAGGARFVLIKRTDSTSGWYVYDTARGMTTMTNPYLFLNSSAAESATLGSVTTVSTGFALNSTILAAINESGGTYIFLAIA
jgi:hypothetical protein